MSAKYGMQAFTQHVTMGGAAWAAQITRDGQVVLYVEQDGRGGCNRYTGRQSELERFGAEARRIFGDVLEPEDLLALALSLHHELGVPLDLAIAGVQAEAKEASSGHAF